METGTAVITLELEAAESEALRAWLDASPEKIILPDPCTVLSMNGTADVTMEDVGGRLTFHLQVGADRLPLARDLATSLLRAMSDDAVRLHRWVPDFGNERSDMSAFWDDMLQRRNRVPGTLFYSDPDFVILAPADGNYLSAWFEPDGDSSGGVVAWDKRMIVPLKRAISAEGPHQRYMRHGLPARGLPGAIDYSFSGLMGVPALVERRRQSNATLLEKHPLGPSVDPLFQVLYVDPDLVYVRDWMSGVFWLIFKRDGFVERRRYDNGPGRKHAVRAAKAMALGTKPGNEFRKWVEKQDYGFDVSGP